VGRNEVILIDTHVALWIATTNKSIGKRSRQLLEEAASQERLLVSAISFWEIALLVTKQRLIIDRSPTRLRRELLEAGVTELPLTGPIAIRAAQLENLHADPADRFIVATAIIHGATLMTADAALLNWPHAMQRHDASK
jgi:PIN domain nuclease of toxin-antitoxin system